MTLNGFHGQFTASLVQKLEKMSAVEGVYEDSGVTMMGQEVAPPSWGQSRTSQRATVNALRAPLPTYLYNDAAGSGIDVFLLDTGVQTNQTDFEGRASIYYDYYPTQPGPDGVGHGTHVAGTIGSKTYGIAKKVTIHSIRVLDSTGSGSFSTVISGIQQVMNWKAIHKLGQTRITTVISMSLGGSLYLPLNTAVTSAVAAGIVVVVAAGNSNDNASHYSPASTAAAITVGAIGSDDTKASYSNYGSIVDIWAPGTNITSLWKGSIGAKNAISGTSMATPHVTGVVSLFLSEKSYTSMSTLNSDLRNIATTNVIRSLPSGNNNVLVYNDALSSIL